MPDKLSPVDFPANPLEKTGYILEFNDEFDGPSIDTDKWVLTPAQQSLLLIILGPTNQREAMSWEMQKEDEP